MKIKTISFYVTTFLIVASMTAVGIINLMRTEMAVQNMAQLNLPIYMASILGAGKVLGSIGVLQRINLKLNEWAYVGFFILFSGAFFSHLLNGDEVIHVISPIFFLGLLIVSYLFRDSRAKI